MRDVLADVFHSFPININNPVLIQPIKITKQMFGITKNPRKMWIFVSYTSYSVFPGLWHSLSVALIYTTIFAALRCSSSWFLVVDYWFLWIWLLCLVLLIFTLYYLQPHIYFRFRCFFWWFYRWKHFLDLFGLSSYKKKKQKCEFLFLTQVIPFSCSLILAVCDFEF